jgi:PKD repeat protein
MKGIVQIAIILIFSVVAIESVTAQMVVPGTLCLNEQFKVESNSGSGVVETTWDFCEGDLMLTPSFQVGSISAATIPVGTSLIKSNGNWYGFICSQSSNSLIRLDFGLSLNNSPQTVNLGNIGGLLNSPQDIEVIEFASNYYAFVFNISGNKLIRINLGTNIETTTATSNAILSGSGFTNGGLEVEYDGTQWVAAITNSTTITLVTFGNNLATIPVASDIMTTSVIAGVSAIAEIKFIKESGIWYGFIAGYNSYTLHRLTFGANLFANPTSSLVYTFIYAPYGFSMANDNGAYFLIVSTLPGNLLRMNFGNSVTNTPVYSNLGNLGGLTNLIKMDLALDQSEWFGLTANWNSKTYYLIKFQQPVCKFNKAFSTSATELITCGNQPGTCQISLYEKDISGQTSVQRQLVIASGVTSPVLGFSTNSICENVVSTFTPTSTLSLTSFEWDFDIYGTSNDENPSILFAEGIHPVQLKATATNGCSNLLVSQLTVYKSVNNLADFDTPAGLLCTNEDLLFINKTNDTYDGNLDYQWITGGQIIGTDRDLIYAFNNAAETTIQLKISIPGCEDISETVISNILEGPIVDFTIGGKCEDEVITITNLSSGVIDGYTWTLDNDVISTESNLNLTFQTPAQHNITLSAAGNNGCFNEITKLLPIYSVPRPDFFINLPPFSCNGTPTQFNDATLPLTDSNITLWQWNFNDGAGSTSSQQNPQHTYNVAGIYNVSLHMESNFGCEATVQIPIEISESPAANFAFGSACLNRGTQFQGTSDAVISAWKWTINNTFYGFPEPTHTFNFSGNYPVTLTVVGVNGCEGSLTKTVEIKPIPLLDFNTSIACSSQETTFTDQTTGVDLPQTWQWNFESNTMAEGSPASYTFETAGAKPVKMSIVTQSGCEYWLTKNVVVAPSPTASFTTSETFGAPPLAIQFTNTSLSASGYSWNFGANTSSSTESNPVFTYTQLGEYLIELTATNGAGCADVARQSIQVLVPRYNLSLENLVIQEGSSYNAKVPVVTITNNSNVPVAKTDIWVTGSSGLRVKSIVDLNLDPGAMQELTLPLEVFTNEKFICVELNPTADADLTDNQRCENLMDQPVLVAPYPNPTSGVFWLDVVLTEAGVGSLKIVDNMGKIVFAQEFESLHQGMNRVEIDFSNQPPGMYVALWNVGSKQTEFRFIRQ